MKYENLVSSNNRYHTDRIGNIFSNNRQLDFRKFTEIHATIKHNISSRCPLYICRINQSDMSSHK